ncbi:hypothetical protein I302_108353 [Kwoniella bestiolae CBS 10118]|uniref:Uncharacterized protein n=1 Tax=Kwoniella bestiolae CBS 10118 TaxID=1296100 RepID=A0AAJ8KE85_9TREE
MTTSATPSPSRSFVAFGNNTCSNLDPTCCSIIREPTDLTAKYNCEDICWSSWTCTIGKNPLKIWGSDPLVVDNLPTTIDYSSRVIGFERPLAFLLENGQVKTIEQEVSRTTWDEVVMTGLGIVYACKDSQLYRFESLHALMRNDASFGPIRGLPPRPLKLYSTESRAVVLVNGQTQLLYEIIDVKSLPPKLVKTKDPVQLKYIDELEASGDLSVVVGSANRIGVVTELGTAYVLPPKGDIETISFDDEEVRLMGIGANFEIVVTDKHVHVRGSSESECLQSSAKSQINSDS